MQIMIKQHEACLNGLVLRPAFNLESKVIYLHEESAFVMLHNYYLLVLCYIINKNSQSEVLCGVK